MKEIELTKGKKAIVDDQDFESLSAHSWHARQNNTGNWYATTTMCIGGRHQKIHMHRFVLGIYDPDVLVDHRDSNSLNNCRNNLRLATHTQNTMNSKKRKGLHTSAHKGVHFSSRHNRWIAELYSKRKRILCKRFLTETEAAAAYNVKAKEVFGEYARLNVL